MDFSGKPCGICEKGKLRKIMDEAEPGVFVEAYQCNKCKEISYSENVMRKVEALRKMEAEERHIVQVGSSLAVPIPAIFVRKLGLKARERVFIFEKNGDLLIKPNLV